jgi:hypothetical protein
LSYVLLIFHAKKTTADIRKIESKMLGKDGKYTYLSNNVMNFKAIPIVPETNITIMQSFNNFLQLSYTTFIINHSTIFDRIYYGF